MKTIAVICFLVFAGSLLTTCNHNRVCPELSIEGAFPFFAPPNDPVLIKGTGFNQDDITVRFGTQKADILENNKDYISTKVPAGLKGVVEMSVSNAQGCLATMNFEVSSSNPAPGSPPVYFIPPSGFAFPVQIPMEAEISFDNVYDSKHSIKITSFQEVMVIDGYGSECWGSESWDCSGGETSPISGNVNLPKNEINLKIDRSEELFDDELIGGIYTMTLNIDGKESMNNFFIAFSRKTGRQYIFHINRF